MPSFSRCAGQRAVGPLKKTLKSVVDYLALLTYKYVVYLTIIYNLYILTFLYFIRFELLVSRIATQSNFIVNLYIL